MPLKLTTYHTGSDIPPLPGNDTFHSTTLFRIYEATPGYSPLLIVASLEGQPIAKLLAVVRRSVRLFPPSIIHRCEVFGNAVAVYACFRLVSSIVVKSSAMANT